MMLFIRFYQNSISPLKPSCCRFYPTCSHYAMAVYERFGFLRGSYLALKRLLKCHPFHSFGVDLPPERFSFFEKKDSTVCR
ncbi:MAG TPA: membrane protein insertion efficiency factor YidD [Thermotogota bacterium]|nr:membrane protein insertion efficiency factor YidD [Thermotogota bacterium]NLZ14811.1 membrane protein insertion efficiency factor YidD [Thermotogaceae bacterium]MDD8040136.1 membrane protein insertion efficiency factor YidD [Thermotogota bacterium]MDD8052963.1 membrane protein insertion efficiency factor YidD [Thermotogota bacterium]HNR63070.1 membrane protein insertion efficiency factor YidD [Thermotogota bacterium]